MTFQARSRRNRTSACSRPYAFMVALAKRRSRRETRMLMIVHARTSLPRTARTSFEFRTAARIASASPLDADAPALVGGPPEPHRGATAGVRYEPHATRTPTAATMRIRRSASGAVMPGSVSWLLYDRAVGVPERADVVRFPHRRSRAHAVLTALRPRQWTKNLLLFAGIIFAAKLGDASRWAEALAAFAAYCAASSASYLVNDVRDAPHDRAHPVKRSRPIARGELSPRLAEAIAALLLFSAFLLVAPLGVASILFLCTFFALQTTYTLALKHVVLLDVMTIGGLFVVRAAAGAAAVEVRISPWLLLCTAQLALFLALAKRRARARRCRSDPWSTCIGGLLAGARRPVGDHRGSVDRDLVLPVHVHGARVEGDDDHDPLRPLRRVPLPVADASSRSRRGTGRDLVARPADPGLYRGMGRVRGSDPGSDLEARSWLRPDGDLPSGRRWRRSSPACSAPACS